MLTMATEALYGLKATMERNPMLRATLERVRNQRYFDDISIHERMLADRVRVDAYHRAIHKHIGSDDVVLDLGTGTGILSLFAAQKHPKVIYAIDHAEIIELAEHLARHNNFSNIKFIRKHSTEVTTDEKVTVILHEQMGSELFNEYMVQNICDIRDRLSVSDVKILPAGFKLFLEPITLRDDYRMPRLWEMDLHGIRLDAVEPWVMGRPKTRDYVRKSAQRRIMPHEAKQYLCTPEPAFEFDLYSAQPDITADIRQRKPVVQGGRMDGICLYFSAAFDDEIAIENSPFSPRTSWNCHFIRTPELELAAGQVLEIDWQIGDLFNVHTWTPSVQVRAG